MTLFPTFIIEWKAKFKLEISENKVVPISPSAFTDSRNLSMDPLEPQIKNICIRETRWWMLWGKWSLFAVSVKTGLLLLIFANSVV